MKLFKVKTDKSDAKAICEYASINEVPLYTARDENQAECLQLMGLIDIYLKQSTALKNKLHGEETLVNYLKPVYHSLNRSLKAVEKEITILEERLTEIVKEEQQKQLTILKSIPGIGSKTAIMFIVLTDGFSNWEIARQLFSYKGSHLLCESQAAGCEVEVE